MGAGGSSGMTVSLAIGKTVAMTVDGKSTKVKEGETYEGNIVISLK